MSFSIPFATAAFIVISSLSWALLDMSRKKLAESLPSIPIVFWLMILQVPIFILVASGQGFRLPGSDYWLPAAGSVVLNLVANVLFVQAVSLAPLSLAVPILSLTPVFSAVGGFALLSEATSVRQGFGIAIIVAATFALGWLNDRSPSGSSGSQVRRGILLMVAVSFLWALTPVLDKICLQNASSGAHALMQCGAIAGVLWVWLRFRGESLGIGAVKTNWSWFALATLVGASALFFQLIATQSIAVGIFESLKRSLGLLAALVLGWLVFRERVSLSKALLLCVMGVGIFVLLT